MQEIQACTTSREYKMKKMTLCCGMTNFTSIFVLLATILGTTVACPPQCRCTHMSVACTNKILRTVPEGIPRNARRIDLSDNPSLNIPRDYFLQFEKLFTLIINNCGQRGPVFLPNTVKAVYLENNFFAVDALRKMFSNATMSLRIINLAKNNLQPSDVKEILSFLPSTIETINLSTNNITKLTKNEIGRFYKAREINFFGGNIITIEANAFENLTQLAKIMLDDNILTNLPSNIFKHNIFLTELYLGGNNLTTFNASKLGLGDLTILDIRGNSLSTFDIKNISPVNLWLSNNKIERLDGQLFNKRTYLLNMDFYNNNISYISPNAFNNIERIGQLSLQNNSLQSLPTNLFNGISIGEIRLQQNNLFNIKGVFKRIKPSLLKLDLLENKQLHSIDGRDLAVLSNTSIVYLKCEYLRQITHLSNLKSKIICSPKADLVINTVARDGFQCNGFACPYIENKGIFTCIACRKGFYNSCINRESCLECPPGSFYQDQPGSNICKTCRHGQFVPPERSPGTSPLDCRTCPKGTNTSMLAGTRACKCLPGYSRRYRFGPCQVCKDVGYECSNDYRTLRNGFWISWQGIKSDYSSSNLSLEYSSENGSICQHMYRAFIKNLDITDDTYERTTMHFKCPMPLAIKCPMPHSCLGGIQPRCSPGYHGPLCAVCSKGYSRQFNRCVYCPHIGLEILKFIAYIVLFIILCFITSRSDKADQMLHRRTAADIILSCTKILIGFYQVLISMMHVFSSIHWPENLKTATQIYQFIQFQIIKLPSLRCIKPEWNIDAVAEFWIVFFTTVSIPIKVLFYYLIKSLYIHCKNLAPSKAKTERRICARNCAKVIALFLFITYPFISTKTIQILPVNCHSFCTSKQNGTCIHSISFLRSDYSIPCPTLRDYKATLITGYTCLIVPLSLPILLFVLLRSHALRIQTHSQEPVTTKLEYADDVDNDTSFRYFVIPKNRVADDIFCVPTVPIMAPALTFLYENYQIRYWYWEVIEMIRKLLMTMGVIPLLGHTKMALTYSIIVGITFSILHAIAKPLKSKFEGAVQLLSLVLVPLNLAFGVVLHSQDMQGASIIGKEMDSHYVGTLLVAINSVPIFVLIGRVIVVITVKVRSKMAK